MGDQADGMEYFSATGYKQTGAFVSSVALGNTASAGTLLLDLGASEYLGLLGTNKERYVGAFYNFVEPATSSKNTYQPSQRTAGNLENPEMWKIRSSNLT